MSFTSIPSLINLALCLGTGAFVFSRNPKRPAHIGFSLGMAALALIEVSAFMIGFLDDPLQRIFWVKASIVGQAFLPGSWLLFSLSFARSNVITTLRKWRSLLAVFYLIPIGFLILLGSPLFFTPEPSSLFFELGIAGYIFYFLLLMTFVAILMNLEQTFRASSGVARWQTKYMILGVGVIMALQIYSVGQTLLFDTLSFDLLPLDSASLLVANVLILFSLVRHRLLDVDLFVSRYVIYNSVTLILSGVYLLLVGAIVFGMQGVMGEDFTRFIPVIVLAALLFMVIIFLSDSLRLKVRDFINLNFYKNKHDYRIKWKEFTSAVGAKVEMAELLPSLVKWMAQSFGTNDAALWLFDSDRENFYRASKVGSSTAPAVLPENSQFMRKIKKRSGPIRVAELDAISGDPLEESGQQSRLMSFSVWTPLIHDQRMIGVIAIGQKIAKSAYDYHDLELLGAISDQASGQIHRVRLSEELSEVKELRAIHALSSFFIHDLKNHTASLSLLAQNAQVHGENPVFQKDASKTIGDISKKMEKLVQNISAVSKGLVLSFSKVDFNLLVKTTVSDIRERLALAESIQLELPELPEIEVDPEHLENVITNLVINASSAINHKKGGKIVVKTGNSNHIVCLSITDNGEGMSEEFISTSLFKPFRTTKDSGWGVGLFQCQQVVKAHGGRIIVESEEGKGSTFTVELPVGRSG